MDLLDQILQYVNVAAFVGLGIVTFRQWRAHRSEASRWAVLTFAALATVAVMGLVIPDEGRGAVYDWLQTVVIAVLLLFPYFLFRLATSFSEAGPGWADRGAAFLTALVVAWSVFLPRLPQEGEPRSTGIILFVYAVLIQWVALSGFVAVRFWRAGANQPEVARKRMRMLSVAATAMSLAIVISGTSSSDQVGVDVIIQLIALLAVGGFFLAFSPPMWLRTAWRRETQAEARRATLTVLSAETPAEVVERVLPHAAATVAGRGIAMHDTTGNLLGSYGLEEDEAQQLDPSGELDAGQYVKLEYPFGSMIVRTTRHTPFFGTDDIDLLGAIGTVTNLALQRFDAVENEKKLAEARLRRRQALEINDNIVQRLAVAHYSFELGRDEEGKKATEDALKAAQATISNLLGELTEEASEHSPLTRNLPASG